jgi:lipopolysaccharide/colanic/teichoic acid biosynthesis glycosyltransferase
MVKRLFDITASTIGIILLCPVLLLTAVGIRVTSPGPVLYRARRVGRGGRIFVMHKFRTMHVATESTSAITATGDTRVFPLGRILRVLKIDELPQLFDVLMGNMAIVGPRPEDPGIVERHYGPLGMRTLDVAPGVASIGSIYNYTHGDLCLDSADPELSYAQNLLPIKLALEVVYVQNASLLLDLRIILRTVLTIALIALGKRSFADPPEMHQARAILDEQRSSLTH